MTLYTARFSLAQAFAIETFDADTPEKALEFAHETYAIDPVSIDWQSYEPDISALEEIEIIDAEDCTCVYWQSAELRLHLAAPALLDLAEMVVAGNTESEKLEELARAAVAKATLAAS